MASIYKPFSEFKYWFVRENEETVNVFRASDKKKIGFMTIDPSDVDMLMTKDNKGFIPYHEAVSDNVSEEEVVFAYNDWINRPEYFVGCYDQSIIDGMSNQSRREIYINILRCCCYIRAYNNGKDPDNYSDAVDRIVAWLDETDFFTAPASTRFHESFEGGLLYHTLKVYNQIVDLKKVAKFSKVDFASAALVALVHDWCKINLYSPYKKNVKNQETGQWEQVDAYNRGSYEFPHGQQSLELARCFFKFTQEEKLAITHHMGHWYCHPSEESCLQTSNERYPLVHMLQFADQLSITSY